MRQILFLAVVLCLSTVASAFPLHGGNDQMNATVYGVIWDHPGEVLVDVSLAHVVPSDTYLNARLDLVDSDDKFYSPDESSGAGNGDLMDFSPDATGYRAITRALVPFKVPQGVIIKRLRFNPQSSQPFSIDWNAVPQVSGNDLAMKLYGASKSSSGHMSVWNFDLKITNNSTQPLQLNSDDFAILDQFGYRYWGAPHDIGYEGGVSINLMPSESIRTTIPVRNVFELSRPVMLEYDNLTMDISAWT